MSYVHATMAEKRPGPGRPTKIPDAQEFRLRLHPATYEKLKLLAYLEDEAINDLINEAVEGLVENHPRTAQIKQLQLARKDDAAAARASEEEPLSKPPKPPRPARRRPPRQ